MDWGRLEVGIWDILIVLAFRGPVNKEERLFRVVVLFLRAERARRSRDIMNRVEWCAWKFGVLGQSIQDLVVLAERRLTSTWKMLSASEVGTFGEPKPGDFAITRAFTVIV